MRTMPALLCRKTSQVWHWDPYHRRPARRWDALRLTAIPDNGDDHFYVSGFVGNQEASMDVWDRCLWFQNSDKRESITNYDLMTRLALYRQYYRANLGPKVPSADYTGSLREFDPGSLTPGLKPGSFDDRRFEILEWTRRNLIYHDLMLERYLKMQAEAKAKAEAEAQKNQGQST